MAKQDKVYHGFTVDDGVDVKALVNARGDAVLQTWIGLWFDLRFNATVEKIAENTWKATLFTPANYRLPDTTRCGGSSYLALHSLMASI